jgi:glutathione S-transferase
MESVAQVIEQKKIQQVIVDMNDLPSLGLDDQFWLATSWLPRMTQCVVQRVALVLPTQNMYNQLVVESLIRTGRHFMPYDIQFFSSTAEAAEWLLGDQPPMLAALHSEWPYATNTSTALAC